jgi:phosphoglycolate phosphatase
MINLLIFDLDGTLVDTSKDITEAVNYAVEPFGVSPLSVEIIKSMVGSGITNLIANLIHAREDTPERIKQNKDEAVKRFLEYYSEHLLDNSVPYPRVQETLSQLEGYKKAVISNKRESLSKKVLEGTSIFRFFNIILGSDSVPEKKPSPAPVLEVLKLLKLSSDTAVMIGDSNFDIQAGKAAGVVTIAVTYGYRSREVLKDADFMVDSFEEILKVLPEINKDIKDV